MVELSRCQVLPTSASVLIVSVSTSAGIPLASRISVSCPITPLAWVACWHDPVTWVLGQEGREGHCHLGGVGGRHEGPDELEDVEHVGHLLGVPAVVVRLDHLQARLDTVDVATLLEERLVARVIPG